MKRNLLIGGVALLLILTGCGTGSSSVSPKTTPSPQQTQPTNSMTEPTQTNPTTSTTPVSQPQNVTPSVSIQSYDGIWTDGKHTEFRLHFLNENTATIFLSSSYNNGGFLVDQNGDITTTFTSDGKGHFTYKNGRGGEGTGDITLHDNIVTLALTHTKESTDGYDYFSGSQDLSRLNFSHSQFLESKGYEASGQAKNPISSLGGSGSTLEAWVGIDKNGQSLVFFFVDGKFIGTDTAKPHGKIQNMDTSGESGLSITYATSNSNGYTVNFDWNGKKLVFDKSLDSIAN